MEDIKFCSHCGSKYIWKTKKTNSFFDSVTGQSYRRLHRQLVCPKFEDQGAIRRYFDHRKGHGNPGTMRFDGGVDPIVTVKDIPIGATK